MKKKSLMLILAMILLLTLSVFVIKFISKDRDKTDNFASLTGKVCRKNANKPQCQHVNREGLNRLNAFGSAMINFNDFLPGYKGDMSKVYVISLRPDENLYYYNNRSLMWYGLGSTDQNFGKPIKTNVASSLEKYLIRLIYGSPPINDRRQLQTEDTILHDMGAHHVTPLKNIENWLTDLSYMDNLVAFYASLPEDAILYIHCLHGKGRTTTFLVLYDIFKNHKKVSLEDIVNRHHCLGRVNLFDTSLWNRGNKWTQEGLNARKNLVVQFYAYMNATDGYPHQLWSKWSQNKNIDKTPIKIHVRDDVADSQIG